MTTNTKQIGSTSSEQQFKNNNNDSKIHQLPSVRIINTNQSLVQIPTTNTALLRNETVPNRQQTDNLTRRHKGRQRRRKRRRQRRCQRRKQIRFEQEQHQRQHQQQQLGLQTEQNRRYQQLQQLLWQEQQDYFKNKWRYFDSYEASLDEVCNDRQLKAYNLEKMDHKARWEQQQLDEFQGIAISKQPEIIKDSLE
jgi:hypothetical protein